MADSQNQPVDWQNWLRRWDAQQMVYLPDRESRFGAMLDVVEALLPPNFVAVDLACGPGSISQRLLARFPTARSIAVDLDPVLLALGRGALGDVDGRLRWVEADLSQPDWVTLLGQDSVDAVLSTTALHWLSAEHLITLYRQLAELIRPGGVFLNGDHMQFAGHLPTFRQVAETVTARRRDARLRQAGAEDWRAWWDALAQEPSLAELLAERARRFPDRGERPAPILDLHEGALRDAGFREVGTLWQNMHNRVVLAVR